MSDIRTLNDAVAEALALPAAQLESVYEEIAFERSAKATKESKPKDLTGEIVISFHSLYPGQAESKAKDTEHNAEKSVTAIKQETMSDRGTPGKKALQISPDDVRQGSTGDCFFMAALSSLANTDRGRKVIAEMIAKNADGSYTVTFPGDRDHPVTVTGDDIKNARVTNGANWADVAETAFLKYTTDGALLGDVLKQQGIPVFGKVTNMREAIRLLTGDSVAADQFALTDLGSQQLSLGATSRENVRSDLIFAMRNQSVVTAGASPDFARFILGNSPGPIPDQHAYAVLDFDPETDTVVVRNPWGSNNGSPLAQEGVTVEGVTNIGGGKLRMSLDTFMSKFGDVTFSGKDNRVATAEHIYRDAAGSAGNLIDAGESLIEGNPQRAVRHLTEAAEQYVDVHEQTLYAVTSTLSGYAERLFKNPGIVLAATSPVVSAAVEVAAEHQSTAAAAAHTALTTLTAARQTLSETAVQVASALADTTGAAIDTAEDLRKRATGFVKGLFGG